tara:strand:+ start:181 stop:609 length:429 start_codon:yes stop_codon:yes gene_type:complete
MKTCTKCKETKSLSLFGNHIRTADGKRVRCKACEAVDNKESRQARKSDNPEGLAARDRTANLKRTYGLSVLEWDAKFKKQQGVCAICSGTCVSGRRLAVDHNHSTGVIRDLLCGNCNGGLGKFLEKPELLLKAVEYLRKHNG